MVPKPYAWLSAKPAISICSGSKKAFGDLQLGHEKAFGTIAKSLVSDILMPPIGLLLADVDFVDLFVVLKGEGPFATLADAQAAGAVTLNYGLFINNVISFLIVAWAVFFLVRGLNRFKRREEAAAPVDPPPTPEVPENILLLREIRDSLKR